MKHLSNNVPLAAVGLISAAALAYEILLIRAFAIIHWHHLVATAVSLALLGYGFSGTLLALIGGRLRRHFALAFIANALLFSFSSLACIHLAQGLPLDPQALAWDGKQLAYLAGTFLILAFPFLAAANCIGLSLWHFREQIPRLYAYDLIGAGLGAAVLLAGLEYLSPAENLFGVFLTGILVVISAAWSLGWHPRAVTLAGLLIILATWGIGRPELQPAMYKDLSRSLAIMGAELDQQTSGVAGTVSVVRNDRVPIRHAPGLSLNSLESPPNQLAVFVDGDAIGTLPPPGGPDQSRTYLKELVSTLPYTLLSSPRVAVLYAGVGLGVEQAITQGAASVTALEPNPLLRQLVCEDYADESSVRCDPRSDWRSESPRSFFTRSSDTFDLISLGLDTDPAGLDALKIDFSLTTEAAHSYLQRLSPDGILAIDGPTRYPPRPILRTLDTLKAALIMSGVEDPSSHIAAIRGWQHFSVIASRTPIDITRKDQIRTFAEKRSFDLVWLPQLSAADTNRFQQLSKPAYYLGAAALLDTNRATSPIAERFRFAAVSDDMPFPKRFTRWPEWWQALCCGDAAARSQLDAGLLVGSLTLLVVTASGLLLVILPLFRIERRRAAPIPRIQRIRTLIYFALVGFAFLFVEIAWIQRLQLYLGHPVFATTAVLVSFLVFAGLGSLWAQSVRHTPPQRLLFRAALIIALFSLVYIVFVPSWLNAVANLPLVLRGSLTLVLLAPLAFAMGIPFPIGLSALGNKSEPLIPWAWGINGVASVVSAAAAPLLVMEIGFTGLIGIAVIAYLVLPTINFDRSANN